MTRKTLSLNEELYEYLLAISLREPAILKKLRDETDRYPEANMQIAPEQGQFMALLVQLIGAKKILEIGTFTGYSSLWMALAMPDAGRIITCDTNPDFTSVASRYWSEAGVIHMIELRMGPALSTMDDLLDQGEDGTFDMVFIDADKEQEDLYYERALSLVRTGGLIAIDNIFWDGRVNDPTANDPDTISIRRFNSKLFRDFRVSMSVVPIADGLTLARKI